MYKYSVAFYQAARKGRDILVAKRMMTVALSAAFLVCCILPGSVGCAPPPEPYRAPVPADTVPQGDTTVRYVALTDEEYKKEVRILSVRLPELISSSDDISDLRELYVGSNRYAVAHCKTVTGERRWLLFCFNTGDLELLAKDAVLTSNSGIDSFTFTVTETDNGLLKFPRTVHYLRVSGELREYTVNDRSLSADVVRRTGPVDADGNPVNYNPLPSLDLLTVTSSGIEMGFSRASGDGLFYPFVQIYSENSDVIVTLSGCLLSGSVSESVTLSAFSIVKSLKVKQSGINIELVITLSTENPQVSFDAVERTENHSVATLTFS